MNKTFPVELTEDLHKQLKHAAVDEGVTLHEWIVQTLKEKVEGNHEPQQTSGKRSAIHARRNRNH